MDTIPVEWLVRQTSLEDEIRLCEESQVGSDEDKQEEKKYYTGVINDLMARMDVGDELWWYVNPRPTGTSGFAIVRHGKVIGWHTVFIT